MIRTLAIAMLIMASPAAAQAPPCGTLTEILAAITGPQYREFALFDGATVKNKLPVHVFANAVTGTWSFVLETKPGYACIIISGEGFKPAMPQLGDPL